MKPKTYYAGLLARLSREDGDDLESESITNQREILINYAKNNNIIIVDEYIDDGYSGCNFNRPGFKRLIEDIEVGKINCVLTKDLSRLGRDFIETGRYIEKYFPEHNVRYIAVNDNIDTFQKDYNDDLMPFRLGMNDMYAKDISKKVRSALIAKKNAGQYCGSTPPYGYLKSKHDKHKLIPDPEYSEVVKRIFKLYISGQKTGEIAELLTNEGVPTPIMIKNSEIKLNKAKHPEIWKHETVSRILKNEVYLGTLTQHICENINYKVSKKRRVSKEDWIIKKNAHEPIIDEETFHLAQSIINKSNNYSSDRRNVSYTFSNLVYCKDCGSTMSISYDKARDRVTMNCNNYRRFSKYGICCSHYVNYSKLEKTINNRIKLLLASYKEDKDYFENILKNISGEPNLGLYNRINDYNLQIEKLRKKQDALYNDKFENIITVETYKRLFDECELEIKKLQKKVTTLNSEIYEAEQSKKSFNDFKIAVENYLDCKNPTKEMVNKIINKIYITKDKKVEIHYRVKGNEKILN